MTRSHLIDLAEQIYKRSVLEHIKVMLTQRSYPDTLSCDRDTFMRLAKTSMEAAQQFADVELEQP